MRRPTATEQIFVLSIIACLLAVGLYSTVLRGVYVMQEELRLANTERLEREARTRDADKAQGLVDEALPVRERLLDVLVPVSDPTGFLSMLETLAEEQNVDMEVSVLAEQVQATGSTRAGGVAEKVGRAMRVELMVSGTWANVYELLALYETLPYATTITRAMLRESTEGPGIWVGQIHILVQAK